METGLFFGFFLPGDSLLVTVGLLAAGGHVDLRLLIPLTILAAVGGDQIGYVVGHRSGESLARQYQLFEKHLPRARVLFERHGGKAIVMARFVPIARTFAPMVAGASGMRYRNFVTYNIVGGILWVVSMTWTGYALGRAAPGMAQALYVLTGIIVAISTVANIMLLVRRVTKR